MSLAIDPEFRGLIPPLTPNERAGLERKLTEEGFQPRYGKILTYNGAIVDGHNRYEICSGHNPDGLVIDYESEEIDFAGRADAMRWIILNQSSRRNLDPVSKAELAENLIPLEAEAAKERQRLHGGTAPGKAKAESDGDDSLPLNLEEVSDGGSSSGGEAVEKAAKSVGVNKNTVYRVRRVKKSGRSDLLQRVREESLSLNAAVRIVELYESLSSEVAEAVEDLAHAGHRRVLNDNEELNRLSQIDARSSDEALEVVDVIAGDDKPDIRSVFAAEKYLKARDDKAEREAKMRSHRETLKATPEHSRKYEIIYADPPWQYEAATTTPSRQIENHYPTMSFEEIENLDVPADERAMLFMWCPISLLVGGLSVVEAWGFDYRTALVWDKQRLGMGHYVRQQCELLLVGRKGEYPTPTVDVRPRSLLSEAPGRHSTKPDSIYELLEGMYPDALKVELFARGAREGWDGWGFEYPGAEKEAV